MRRSHRCGAATRGCRAGTLAGAPRTCLAALICLAAISFLLVADTPAIRFIDIAAQSGLTLPNTFGGKDKKEYLLESTGTGAAIFDYDGDGANDIFIANGTV